ncbi:hypothetical protein [Fluviicola sp.]|uniref:hypothetical protein n=1 Tax=Fluviicola sp. TaxID=1917219 RepID=UPI0026170F60|nr:hypothetical protein [Fluviicola sp.]
MNRISSRINDHKHVGLLTVLALFLSLNLYSQQKLILQNQQRSRRTKVLKQTDYFRISTRDGKSSYARIDGFNDSVLILQTKVISGNSVIDTSFSVRIDQITTIKHHKRWENGSLMLPATLATLGGLAAVISIPVEAAKGNTESVRTGLIFFGGLEAVCLSILYFGTREPEYDLVNKWSLRIE